ncbi:hypothetical protein L3X38_037717 [Prunus dulcis]|uniref:Retrotransposon Copia-like N-terminal domain-containing protein n=1 Tax=Prunus dulcis TaxID=3755 RepID=A0AAD4YQY6_PRUDU|nr:hypothetical protein L3X38_037717 [Prunus dulcis]
MTKDQESASSGSKNDAFDPFFIHHSDHPGMVLVPKILNGNNYATCEEQIRFLMGLNESYSAIRGQILLMQPLPKVRKGYSLITQEEKQRDLGSRQAIIELATMAVRNNQRSNSYGRKPLHCSIAIRIIIQWTSANLFTAALRSGSNPIIPSCSGRHGIILGLKTNRRHKAHTSPPTRSLEKIPTKNEQYLYQPKSLFFDHDQKVTENI